jgi:hypothetical protein
MAYQSISKLSGNVNEISAMKAKYREMAKTMKEEMAYRNNLSNVAMKINEIIEISAKIMNININQSQSMKVENENNEIMAIIIMKYEK